MRAMCCMVLKNKSRINKVWVKKFHLCKAGSPTEKQILLFKLNVNKELS